MITAGTPRNAGTGVTQQHISAPADPNPKQNAATASAFGVDAW